MAISEKEIGYFLQLFNRGGYVLDFSTTDFDAFTTQSIGVAVCQKYSLSKGKSLISFIADNTYAFQEKQKLLFDLFDYYKECKLFEDECGEFSESNKFKSFYKKCKEVYDREKLNAYPLFTDLINISNDIESRYVDSQINIIREYTDKNPTVAIGKCKELIETISKEILKAYSITVETNITLPKLVKECMKVLEVLPENISDSAHGYNTLKTLLNNLASISNSMAELRNFYGDGHGKQSDYTGLQPRHARLALGASTTLIMFLWETFKLKKRNEELS